MRIALQNIHHLPNIFTLGIHDYALELIRRGKIDVLYFSDRSPRNLAKLSRQLCRRAARLKFHDIDWSRIEFVFGDALHRKADVVLNLNMMHMPDLRSEFPGALKRFQGLKIFHVGDYFWNHPGSEVNRLLVEYGVDHLFGYAMHDRHCAYFRRAFPRFSGKVWGIPFGYAPRFQSVTPFGQRTNKAVALGSVNPLRPLNFDVLNFRETADFYPDTNWFHEFRRKLVLSSGRLGDVMDSRLPVFPKIKDFAYDLVETLNEYRMFVTCESIFNFPSAKVFEGPACGTAMVCANHECIKEFGFRDRETCVMFDRGNVDAFRGAVEEFQHEADELEAIAARGSAFVRQHYSHAKVSDLIHDTIRHIWTKGANLPATPVSERLKRHGEGAPVSCLA